MNREIHRLYKIGIDEFFLIFYRTRRVNQRLRLRNPRFTTHDHLLETPSKTERSSRTGTPARSPPIEAARAALALASTLRIRAETERDGASHRKK